MQEHFYALYVFTVQSNGGVATTPPPYLLILKTYPTPGEGPIHPVFASKWLQRMRRQLLKIISRKNQASWSVRKNLEGDGNPPFVRRGLREFLLDLKPIRTNKIKVFMSTKW